MSLMEKLRIKLRAWLFREESNEFTKRMDVFNREIATCRDATRACKNAIKLVDECQRLMNSIVDVGTDVGFFSEDHSWAVVCIQGKPEYVKFVPLNHQDARQVLDFLKHFQYSNKVIDSPLSFRTMLDRQIIENPFK